MSEYEVARRLLSVAIVDQILSVHPDELNGDRPSGDTGVDRPGQSSYTPLIPVLRLTTRGRHTNGGTSGDRAERRRGVFTACRLNAVIVGRCFEQSRYPR